MVSAPVAAGLYRPCGNARPGNSSDPIIGINKFGHGLGGWLRHKAVGHKDVTQPLGPGQLRRVWANSRKMEVWCRYRKCW